MEVFQVFRSRDALANALSGAMADAAQVVLLFPMETMKIKLQADATLTLEDLLKDAVEHGHLLSFYKGLYSKLVQSPQGKFQYFYTNVILKTLYKATLPAQRELTTIESLTIGYFSALQGLITSIPLSAATNRIIANAKKTGEAHEHLTLAGVMSKMIQQEGLLSIYRSSFVAAALLCFNPAITFVLFDKIKAYVLGKNAKALTTLQAFVIGAIAKAIATVVSFPLMRCKVMMNTWGKQRKIAKEKYDIDLPEKNESVAYTLNYIVRHEGVGGLYRGLHVQLVKGVTNSALMLALKERIQEMVQALLITSSK